MLLTDIIKSESKGFKATASQRKMLEQADRFFEKHKNEAYLAAQSVIRDDFYAKTPFNYSEYMTPGIFVETIMKYAAYKLLGRKIIPVTTDELQVLCDMDLFRAYFRDERRHALDLKEEAKKEATAEKVKFSF